MFPGETLKKQSSPIHKGDHPELDYSEFIAKGEKAKHMSMISTVLWHIALGRFDVAMTMSAL